MMIQKTLLAKATRLVFLMLFLSACNEQEFYEKSFLEGAGVENSDDREGNQDVDDGVRENPDGGDTTGPGAQPDPAPSVPDSDDSDDADQGQDDGDDADQGQDDGDDADQGQDDGDDADQGQDDGDDADQGQDDGDDADQGQDDGDDADQGQDDGDDADQGQDDGDDADQDQDDGGQDYGDDAGDSADNGNDDEEEVPAVVLIDKKDQFEQKSQGQEKVDILWVVDDSGSMGDEQAALAYNFNAFILDFLNQDIDFNMAITTTDATARGDGKWHGYYKHLTSEAAKKDEDKFLRDFKRTIRVGTRGSAREMGLRTGVRFLQRYANRKALPFLRPDAYLIVVILSDEQDQSPGKVEDYVNAYQSFKSQEGLFKLYSIVVKKHTGNRYEQIGTRYMKASEMSNGISTHLKDDFYQTLRNMGGSIVNLTKSFALSDKPYGGELKLYVDGELKDKGWSYEESTSSIRFNDDSIPRIGAEIEVHYQVEKND